MSVVECAVYSAPSASGGKVWIHPCRARVKWTMSGTYTAYLNRKLKYHELSKPKAVHLLTNGKMIKGYSFEKHIWVDTADGFAIYETDPGQITTSAIKVEKTQTKEKEPIIIINGEGLFAF